MNQRAPSRLEALAFEHQRLAQAVEAVVVGAEFGRPTEPSPVHVPPATARDQLTDFLAHHGQRHDVEVEQLELRASEIASTLRKLGPGLVEVPGEPRRWLALVGCRGDRLRIVDPSLHQHWVPVAEIADLLAAPIRAPAMAEAEILTQAAGFSGRRARRIQEQLHYTQLERQPVRGIWMVRVAAGRPIVEQLHRARIWRPLALLLGARLGMGLTWAVSWWIVGRISLGLSDTTGWLIAWLLTLVTLVPLTGMVHWMQSEVTLTVGIFLRRRLLAGALLIDPEKTKRDGLGRFLALVLDCDNIERTAAGGSIAMLLGTIDLVLVAPFILAAGAGGWTHVGLLAAWLVATTVAGVKLYRRRAVWTDERLGFTQVMVDHLIGQRTRTAQLPRERWHDTEDRTLVQYLDSAVAYDRSRLTTRHLLARGWLVVSIGLLAPLVLSGVGGPGVAIAIGGVLYAYAAFDSVTEGMGRFFAAIDSAYRVAPIYHAAATGRPDPRSIGTGSERFEIPATDADAAPNREPDAPGPAILTAAQVSYHYPERERLVLEDIDFQLRAGERVLLVGPSGAGKSTLASILAAQRRQREGLVLLGRLDLDAVGWHAWRRRVAFVPQFHENHVLSESFLFNLLMARAWPPRQRDIDDAWQVCEELGLGPLLATMPAGMNQMVGEIGWNLSHGERSRLFIARALLQDPDVLVLDESLAALDPNSSTRSAAPSWPGRAASSSSPTREPSTTPPSPDSRARDHRRSARKDTMKVRNAIGLQILSTPEGLGIHVPHVQEILDIDLVEQPGFLDIVLTCDTWTERAQVEERLVREADFDGALAASAIDNLIEYGILISDTDDDQVAGVAALEAWSARDWRAPFEFLWAVDHLPWLDYSADGKALDMQAMRTFLREDPVPENYKHIPDAPRVALLRDVEIEHDSIFTLLEDDDETCHPDRPMTFEELSWMTYLGFGQTGVHSTYYGERLAKTTPSGGARHPTEGYLLILDVDGVDPGAYHYDVENHALELLRAGDIRDHVRDHLLRMPGLASFTHRVAYLSTTRFERTQWRYRDSFSYRSVHHDLGHIMETLRLLARALRRNHFRGFTPTESALEPLLRIDGIEEALMTFSIIG